MITAQAQVLVGPSAFALQQVRIPPPGPGELRLRVHACGICGSDKVLALVSEPGTVLGHEVVAEVESCGPGVSGWQPGDRAVPLGNDLGFGPYGGFGEWIITIPSACVRVPENLPSLAAVLAEPIGNGLHFVRRGRLRPGQNVAIFGAGQIGLSMLFWARRLGAGRIVVSEPAAARAEMARALGADAVINPRECDDLKGAMTEALGGRPDAVFEAAGRIDVMQTAIEIAGKGAVIVLAGISLDELTIRPASLCLKETDLVFPIGTDTNEVREVIDVLARGEFPAARFVSHRISMEEIPEAIHSLGRPTDQIKVVVDYSRRSA